MAVPRPLLLALVGVVLLSGVFVATRNMRHETSSSSSPPVATTPKQAPRPAAKSHPASRPARDRTSRAKADVAGAPAGKPGIMAKAIAKGRVVVLFLFQPRGGDDGRVAKSVTAVRREHGVTVLRDTIEHVGRYAPMVGDLNVSQAPAVVIVDRDRRGHLIEGYVDGETLRQEVADLRR